MSRSNSSRRTPPDRQHSRQKLTVDNNAALLKKTNYPSTSSFGVSSRNTSIAAPIHYQATHHSDVTGAFKGLDLNSNSLGSHRLSTYANSNANGNIPSRSRDYTNAASVQQTLSSLNKNDSCGGNRDCTTDVAVDFPRGNVGLVNLGNTCFMNSVLQCLINTKILRDYVLSKQGMADIKETTNSRKGLLIKSYAKLVEDVWSPNPPKSISPKDLKDNIQKFAPRFTGYNQQDAQEFLRYLLQGLHEDVNRVTSKPKYIGCDEEAEEKMSDEEKASEHWKRYLNFDNSAIVDMFVGQLKSTLTCKRCGYKSVTFDPFWDLSLPIPKTGGQVDIQDCLRKFMEEEVLDGDERPTCARCKSHQICYKSFKIQKLPKILVLHLKRFSGERYRQKLSTKVTFETRGLNIKQHTVDCVQNAIFNLYGISNHIGSVHSGHYTSYCRHPDKGRWFSFDDSSVSSISENLIVSEEAYVLFYEQA